jgi:RNA polymerase sigma-70 factor (ECF subfamily)
MDLRPRRLRAVAGGEVTADDELLRQIARGDQEAFAVIYDRYAGVVFGVIRRVLRDPAQSEEVAQEVMVEAWKTAVRFDPERGSVRTWLCTMAHRRAVDRVRSEQDHVAEAVAVRIEHQQVRDALATLTDRQREAVELAYYGGYTYREVAELLDSPLGTVKTRMRDGLIRLRDAMGVTA